MFRIIVLAIAFIYTFSLQIQASTGVLSHEVFQRLNTPQNQTKASNWLTFSLEADEKTKYFDVFVDGSVRFYYTADDYVYSVPEAYLNFENENERTTVGRKIVDWNPNEKFWSLNHINGMQAFTLLGDKQEGLLGFHYDRKSGPFEMNFILSYFYVPQLNPSLDVEDGKITSKSEWAKIPPSSTMIKDQVVPIYYSIDMPKASEVLFQKSLGTRMAYNWKGGKIAGYGLYKPENTLRINAEAYYDQSMEQVVVNAKPIVNHHLVYGANIGQKVYDLELGAGVEVIEPSASIGKDFDKIDPIKNSNEQRTFESEYFSIKPSYERESYMHFSANLDRPIFDLSLNYIHLLSKHNKGDDFYSDTAKWKRAVGFAVDYAVTEKFNLLLSIRYDLFHKDNVFKNEYAYKLYNELTFALGFELIEAPDKRSYWSAFRTNDTIYSTLAYTF